MLELNNNKKDMEQTRTQMKSALSDGQTATGEKFSNLIDSVKWRQTPVSDPSASGTSVTFIATITQDAEGRVTVVKKRVDFGGYQTVAAMAGYQDLDLQQVGDVIVAAGENQTIVHNMKHYPTVRLINEEGIEVKPSEYQVKHTDDTTLDIILGGSLSGRYRYILD